MFRACLAGWLTGLAAAVAFQVFGVFEAHDATASLEIDNSNFKQAGSTNDDDVAVQTEADRVTEWKMWFGLMILIIFNQHFKVKCCNVLCVEKINLKIK